MNLLSHLKRLVVVQIHLEGHQWSRLCEGGDIYSPEGKSTVASAGSQQGRFGSGSQ